MKTRRKLTAFLRGCLIAGSFLGTNAVAESQDTIHPKLSQTQKDNTMNLNTIFPVGDKNEAYKDVFTGQSYLAMLASSPDKSVSVGNVTFEPGCRNFWHVHQGGYQILLVTAGEGLYQEEGKPARLLKAGDMVVTNDGVKHWHGATNSSWFSHVAITAGKGVFLEAVSDEQYAKVHKDAGL